MFNITNCNPPFSYVKLTSGPTQGKQECQNVGTGKSFTINFMPYSSTSGKNDPVLSQSMCEQLCQQAKSKCDYGGSWEMSAPPMDGGDEITVEVTVVLNENAC